MVFTMYREDIPEWAMKEMMLTCEHCGCFIADNSDTGVTTSRWCVNPKCPGHMSMKADELAKMLGVKQVGPKTLCRQIKVNSIQSHFEFVPRWFEDVKPEVSLPQIAVMACIDGFGKPTAESLLSHYYSFEDYFNSSVTPHPLLLANKELLLEAEKYFKVKPPLSARQMKVMATGSFKNYSSREEYFNLINTAYGMYINVIQTGKRKTGVSYLIMEPTSRDSSKYYTALECGIPIVTPAEFLSIIQSMCPYIPEE